MILEFGLAASVAANTGMVAYLSRKPVAAAVAKTVGVGKDVVDAGIDAAHAAKNEVDKRARDFVFAAVDTWRGGCEWCVKAREAAAKWVDGQIDRLPHRRIEVLAAELAALKQSAIDAERLSDRISAVEGRKPVGVARAMEYGDLDAIPVLEPVAEQEPVVEAPADEVIEPAPVAAEQDQIRAVKIPAKLLRSVLRGGQSDHLTLSVRNYTATLCRDRDVTHTIGTGCVKADFLVKIAVGTVKAFSTGDGDVEVKYTPERKLLVNGTEVAYEEVGSRPVGVGDIAAEVEGDWEPDYEVLARVKDHAARYDVRYFLNGVRVLADDEGGYRMVASDGHRMIVSPRIEDEAAFDCLIPRREILNAKGKGWLQVENTKSGQRITSISAGYARATVATPEMGQYPDVDRLIPAATVHLGRLTKSMIPEVKALGKGDFEFEGLTFQAPYILDALKALGDCDAATDDRGGIVRLTNAEGYVAIVMPRRV